MSDKTERLTDCAQGYCEVYCDHYTSCFSEPDVCERKYEVQLYERLKDYESSASMKQPRWISVEERLPEDDGHVLIYSLGGGVAEGIYSKIYKKWVQYRWSVLDIEVTHWMPLPEPPKEEV